MYTTSILFLKHSYSWTLYEKTCVKDDNTKSMNYQMLILSDWWHLSIALTHIIQKSLRIFKISLAYKTQDYYI